MSCSNPARSAFYLSKRIYLEQMVIEHSLLNEYTCIPLKVLYAKNVWYSFALKERQVEDVFLQQAIPRNSDFWLVQKFNSNTKAVYFEICIYAPDNKKMDFIQECLPLEVKFCKYWSKILQVIIQGIHVFLCWR